MIARPDPFKMMPTKLAGFFDTLHCGNRLV